MPIYRYPPKLLKRWLGQSPPAPWWSPQCLQFCTKLAELLFEKKRSY